MLDFSFIDQLTSIDPGYIMILAGSVFGFVQALKKLGGWVSDYALLWAIFFSAILATLVIYELNKIVSVIILTQLIAAAGAGLYSWGSKKEDVNVDFANYLDQE